MDQDEINKIVSGDPSEEEIKSLEAKLSEAGKSQLREVMALKAQRKSEEKRLADLKGESEASIEAAKKAREAEEDRVKKARESQDQFRLEQITKARDKFFAEYKIPAELQNSYEDTFNKLDSGKVDPDLIFQDFVAVYAAKNSSSLLQAQKEKEEMEKNAALNDASAAAGNGSQLKVGKDGKEYPKQVLDIAKESGITPEAASKIYTEGYSRLI